MNLPEGAATDPFEVDKTAEGGIDDWSETARAAITRRDHLIRLGLAKRKSKTKMPTTEKNNQT